MFLGKDRGEINARKTAFLESQAPGRLPFLRHNSLACRDFYGRKHGPKEGGVSKEVGKDIEKKAIVVFAEKCVGCVSCQLRCSLHKLKRFCPDRASVQVKRIAGKGKEQFSITFLEDCRQCGICARYCLYGALVYEKREEGA